MRKSQLVFAIMAAVYTIIAILYLGKWIEVSENILLGLSMAALLSSLSDVLSNIVGIRASQNELGYIAQTTSNFLEIKISNNLYSSSIDTRNVKFNVENLSKGYKTAVHPNEYWKRRGNVLINVISQICFVLSIVTFILSPFPFPFPLALSQQPYSVLLTLLAFAAMCFNLYLEERISDILQQKNHFFFDTQLIIQIAYPDFTDFLNFRLYHYKNYISTANRQEEKPDAHT